MYGLLTCITVKLSWVSKLTWTTRPLLKIQIRLAFLLSLISSLASKVVDVTRWITKLRKIVSEIFIKDSQELAKASKKCNSLFSISLARQVAVLVSRPWGDTDPCVPIQCHTATGKQSGQLGIHQYTYVAADRECANCPFGGNKTNANF